MSQSSSADRPVIRKGEQCMSCLHKAQDEETDEGTIIICEYELRPGGVNELPFSPSESCDSWSLNPEASMWSVEEEEQLVPAALPDETPELLMPFVFRGDSLVKVDEEYAKDREDVLRLRTSFVEKYNAFIQLSRQEVEQRIDDIRAALVDKLSGIKNAIKEEGDQADIDEMFMSPLFPEDEENFIFPEDDSNTIEGEALQVESALLLEDEFGYADREEDPDISELSHPHPEEGSDKKKDES